MSLIKKIKAKIALKRLANFYDKKSKEFCKHLKLVKAAKDAADYLKDKGLDLDEVNSVNTIYNDLFGAFKIKDMEAEQE
jgi:hypothetical protein